MSTVARGICAYHARWCVTFDHLNFTSISSPSCVCVSMYEYIYIYIYIYTRQFRMANKHLFILPWNAGQHFKWSFILGENRGQTIWRLRICVHLAYVSAGGKCHSFWGMCCRLAHESAKYIIAIKMFLFLRHFDVFEACKHLFLFVKYMFVGRCLCIYICSFLIAFCIVVSNDRCIHEYPENHVCCWDTRMHMYTCPQMHAYVPICTYTCNKKRHIHTWKYMKIHAYRHFAQIHTNIHASS
jgi:hypothetical protein